MINIFLNEEYGYRHWWWEYPGNIDDLIEDWNSGNAPSFGKPYRGTLTELPTQASPDNPFSTVMAGSDEPYIIHQPGQVPVLHHGVPMRGTFDATATIGVDDPILRVEDQIYPGPGDLTWEEREIADRFRWSEWSEDPAYYERWFDDWKKTYSCGRTDPKLLDALKAGMLSPQRSEELASHIEVCIQCRNYCHDPDLVNLDFLGECWPRPKNWKYPEDWGSRAWKRRMSETYRRAAERAEREGFIICPKCGVEHTTYTVTCRKCNYSPVKP